MNSEIRLTDSNASGPAIVMVEAGLERISELVELNRQLQEGERSGRMTRVQLIERMAYWLECGHRCYMARQGDHPVGYCLFMDMGSQYYLRHLVVSCDWRRRGIATTMLDWMYANEWTDKPVSLEVLLRNKPALDFYLYYGFLPTAVAMQGTRLACRRAAVTEQMTHHRRS